MTGVKVLIVDHESRKGQGRTDAAAVLYYLWGPHLRGRAGEEGTPR